MIRSDVPMPSLGNKYEVIATWRGKLRKADNLTEAQAVNQACEWLREGKVKALVVTKDGFLWRIYK